jgi:hypothetical protein
MRERRRAYRILVGKREGKRPLGRPRLRWEDNVKIELQEIECEGVHWNDLAQDGNLWKAFVNAAMNLRIQYNA